MRLLRDVAPDRYCCVLLQAVRLQHAPTLHELSDDSDDSDDHRYDPFVIEVLRVMSEGSDCAIAVGFV